MAAKAVQKSAVEALDEQELMFVLKLIEFPRTLTIGQCGAAAGYDEMYAYRKARSAKIQNAIDELIDERSADFKAQTYRVLVSMGAAAERGDHNAAKVYLDAMGRGSQGLKIINNVSANAQSQEPFGDRVRRLFGERGVLGVEDEGETLVATGETNAKANGNGSGQGRSDG